MPLVELRWQHLRFLGYEDDVEVPGVILDDRAFARGFFKAPFEFAMDPRGHIRAKGFSPAISLRELSARLQGAFFT